MPKIIEFYDEDLDGTFYVEVEEATWENESPHEGFRDIRNEVTDEGSATVEKFKGRISDILQSLRVFGKGVLNTVQDLEPDEVEVKAGLKFEVREGMLIGMFAQGRAEFPFEVKLTWKKGKEESLQA